MDIRFCDICNESVPAPDLAAGRAIERGDRIVCGSCERAMTGGERAQLAGAAGTATLSAAGAAADVREAARVSRAAPPAPPAPPTGAFLAGAMSAVAVLFAVGVLLMMLERTGRLEEDGAAAVGSLRSELASTARSLEADVDAARAVALDELDAVRSELAQVRVEARGGADAARAARGELDEAVAGFTERHAGLERRLDELARSGAAGDLPEELAAVEAELRGLAERVRELEDVAVLEEAAAGADPPAAGPPPWQGLLDDLADENAGVRWSAVQALGETGDPAVAPHLAGALDDPDIFVRMAAARLLGDLRAFDAIPDLIDTLEDEEPSVREAAAVSLRAITERDFGFDPLGTEAERGRSVAAWRAFDRRRQAEGE